MKEETVRIRVELEYLGEYMGVIGLINIMADNTWLEENPGFGAMMYGKIESHRRKFGGVKFETLRDIQKATQQYSFERKRLEEMEKKLEKVPKIIKFLYK